MTNPYMLRFSILRSRLQCSHCPVSLPQVRYTASYLLILPFSLLTGPNGKFGFFLLLHCLPYRSLYHLSWPLSAPKTFLKGAFTSYWVTPGFNCLRVVKHGENFNTPKWQSMSLVFRQSIPLLAIKDLRSSQARHDGSFDSRRQESQWIGADDSITFTRLYLGSSRVLICITSFEAESVSTGFNRDAFELNRT